MQTEEVKPVRCGCGGEAVVIRTTNKVMIWCNWCGLESRMYDTEAEAIEAWNRAMSGDVAKNATTETAQECANFARCKERTAKVEKVDTNSPHSQVYKCCECGQYTHRTAWSRDVHYCPSCGARLEWK